MKQINANERSTITMSIFLNNKYTKWYYNIITAASNRQTVGYVERHHIIPKSLGGSNDHINLVDLTAREHFICHRLLPKMTEGKHRNKMLFAFRCIVQCRNNYQPLLSITSRTFEIARQCNAEAMSNRIITDETREKMRAASKLRGMPINCLPASIRATTGRPLSQEHKAKLSAALQGRIITDDHRTKISQAKLGKKRDSSTLEKMRPTMFKLGRTAHNKGQPMSEEQKRHLSDKKLAQATKYFVYDTITNSTIGPLTIAEFCRTHDVKYYNAQGYIINKLKYKHWTFTVA